MTKEKIHSIWNPDIGVTDLADNLYGFKSPELKGIRSIWKDQQERLKNTAQLEEFVERVSREWAIETGIIENLYDIDRGITQTLIEHGFQADIPRFDSNGTPKEYVLRLLRDQKEALDGVFDFVKGSRNLSTSYIKELHAILLKSQETTEALDSLGKSTDVSLIKGDWKRQPNHPTRGEVTYQYCPPEQVSSEMDRLMKIHSDHISNDVESVVMAAWLHHRFTQIHPFQDGNGRVARSLASLVFIQDGLFPLVVHRDYRKKYLDALEIADANDLMPLIKLFIVLQTAQFRKAAYISEGLLAEDDITRVLDRLDEKARQIREQQSEEFKKVFFLANALENNIRDRLEEIRARIYDPLEQIAGNASVFVNRSDESNDYYFRHEIIKNANEYLHYFADTSEYRSWVSINMRWSTRNARLVFTLHGLGKPFNGSLICSPFLEFRDKDDEEIQTTFVPIAEEGFVFFYTEEQIELLTRFDVWRDNVLKVAVAELTLNL